MYLSRLKDLPTLAVAKACFDGIRSTIARCSSSIPPKSIDFSPSSTAITLFKGSNTDSLSGTAEYIFTRGNTRTTPEPEWSYEEFQAYAKTAHEATAQAIKLVREALKLNPNDPDLHIQLASYLSRKRVWVYKDVCSTLNQKLGLEQMDSLQAEILVRHKRGVNLSRKAYTKDPSQKNAQALIDAIAAGLDPWDSFIDDTGNSEPFHQCVSEIFDIASKHRINIDGIKNRLQNNHMRQFRNGFSGPSSSWKRFPDEAILRDVSPHFLIDRFNTLAKDHGITPLGENPTKDELKTAYRALSMQLHPDTSGNPSTVTQFKELSGIYKTLQEHLN